MPSHARRLGTPDSATAAALALILLAAPTRAQSPANPANPAAADAWARAGLRRIDPGTADSDPLSVDARHLFAQPRLEQGYQTLFAAPGYNRFARRDGGVTALFPRSVYIEGPFGPLAAIPPDTLFVVGDPPPWLESWLAGPEGAAVASSPQGFLVSPGRVNSQQITALPPDGWAPRLFPQRLLPRSAEAARQERQDIAAAAATRGVSALLRQAAEADRRTP